MSGAVIHRTAFDGYAQAADIHHRLSRPPHAEPAGARGRSRARAEPGPQHHSRYHLHDVARPRTAHRDRHQLQLPATTYDYTFTVAAPTSGSALRQFLPRQQQLRGATASPDYPQPPQTVVTRCCRTAAAKLPHAVGQSFTTRSFCSPWRGSFYASQSGLLPDPGRAQQRQLQLQRPGFQWTIATSMASRCMTNITWSHALDENPYESTVVPSYNAYDPTNPRAGTMATAPPTFACVTSAPWSISRRPTSMVTKTTAWWLAHRSAGAAPERASVYARISAVRSRARPCPMASTVARQLPAVR